MRCRNIKVGFWINEDIAKLSHTGRLLFIGLWCLADREGKLEYRPERILHELFGYDVKKPDINRELTVISRLGFVSLYQVAGSKYILIKNFLQHQHPHNTEAKSKLPNPDGEDDFNGELTVSSREPNVNVGLDPDVLGS